MKWSSKDILAKHNHFGKEIPKVLKIVKEDPRVSGKLHVGDSVTILKDLRERHYNGCGVVGSMLKYKGKQAKITGFGSESNRYKIDLDGNRWWWSSEMFEPAVFAVGDRVRIISDLVEWEEYGKYCAVPDMMKHCGKEASITEVVDNGVFYRLNIDSGLRMWTPQMLTAVSAEREFHVGDRVRVKSTLVIGEIYDGVDVNGRMAELGGRTYVITEVSRTGMYKLFGYLYCWSAEMFEEAQND